MASRTAGLTLGLFLATLTSPSGLADVRTIEFGVAFGPSADAIASDPALDLGFAYSGGNGILFAYRLSTGVELDRLARAGRARMSYDPSTRTLVGGTTLYNQSATFRSLTLLPIVANPVTGEVFDEDALIQLDVPGEDFSELPYEYWKGNHVIDPERGLCFQASFINGGGDDDVLRIHAIDIAGMSVIDTLTLPQISTHRTHWDPALQRLTLAESDEDADLLVVDASGPSPEIFTGNSPVIHLGDLDTDNVYEILRPAYLGDIGFYPSLDDSIRAFNINTGTEMGSLATPMKDSPNFIYANQASESIFIQLDHYTSNDFGPCVYEVPVDLDGPSLFPDPFPATPTLLELPDGWKRDDQDGTFIDFERDLIITSCADHIFTHRLSTLELVSSVEASPGSFNSTRWQSESQTLTRTGEVGGALIYHFGGPPNESLAGPFFFDKPGGISFSGDKNVILDATDRLAIIAHGRLVSVDLASEEITWHNSVSSGSELTQDRVLNRVANQGCYQQVWEVSPDFNPPLSMVGQVGWYNLDYNTVALFDETRGLTMSLFPNHFSYPREIALAVYNQDFTDVTLIDLGIDEYDADNLLPRRMCEMGQRVVIEDEDGRSHPDHRADFLIVDVSDSALAHPGTAEIWWLDLHDLTGGNWGRLYDSFICDPAGRLGFAHHTKNGWVDWVTVIDIVSSEVAAEINLLEIEGIPSTVSSGIFTTPDGQWLCVPFFGDPLGSVYSHLAVVQIDPDVPGVLVGDWRIIPIVGVPFDTQPIFTDDLLFIEGRDDNVNRTDWVNHINWRRWANMGAVRIPDGSRFCDASRDGSFLIAVGGEYSNLLHIIDVPPPLEIQGLVVE